MEAKLVLPSHLIWYNFFGQYPWNCTLRQTNAINTISALIHCGLGQRVETMISYTYDPSVIFQEVFLF